jgi:hypothetical protein
MTGPLDLTELNLIGLNIGCGRDLARHYSDRGFLYVDAEDIAGELIAELPGSRLLRTSAGYHYLQCDLTNGLPIKAACVEAVFLEHVVEHLALGAAVMLLRDAHRALVAGGCLRVSVPDLALYVSAYVNRDHTFFRTHARGIAVPAACTWEEVIGDLPENGAPFLPATLDPDLVTAFLSRPAAAVNQIFQFWGHRWVYDFDEMKALLVAAGFAEASVEQAAYRSGRNPRLAGLDRDFRKDESLYVEAVK